MNNDRLAVIYFDRDSGKMAKDLAARLRNEGTAARLCWADRFNSEDDLEQCQAVIIEHTVHNASDIAQSYNSFAHGVEIHYIDANGDFCDETGDELPREEEGQPSADAPQPTAVPETAAESEESDESDESGESTADDATDASAEEDGGGPNPVET